MKELVPIVVNSIFFLKECFGTLPNQYEQEINKKFKITEDNLTLIQSANLNKEQCMMLQKFIDNNFKESLQISGEQRQLEHLSIMSSTLVNQNAQISSGI